MISIKEVSFSYEAKQPNLHTIDLQVKPGECILLSGSSGCGKTTVTKLINGLIPHFYHASELKGEVIAAEKNVWETELYELAKRVGSVFQNPKSQFFTMDADSELAFGLENEGRERAYILQRVETTVRELGIERLLGRGIFHMSGGEKQLLAFASVYAMNPDIYVLDEPTANLDHAAIETIREQIKKLKALGKTVVIAEHRLYFLVDLIDRAFYIKEGRIEKRFNQKEFCALSVQEQKQLGLRTFTETAINLPAARQNPQDYFYVEELSVSFKKQPAIFKQITFSVQPGEVLAITGRNGVGKTTLGKCLCGLLKETTGKIVVDQQTRTPKQRQRSSFCVMQDVHHQLFSDSVWGECELAIGRDDQTDKINETLDALQLLAYKQKHPMALSGGQKQRLAIATALLSQKKVIIFDEPTSGLDYEQMKNVVRVIEQLKQAGKIILVISHDYEFINDACDRVLEI